MKILPVVSSGEVFLLPDGTPTLLPFQVFFTGTMTILRIGDTTYWFDKDGRYDGVEVLRRRGNEQPPTGALMIRSPEDPPMTGLVMVEPKDDDGITAMMRAAAANRGNPPDLWYFPEDTVAGVAERRSAGVRRTEKLQ